jgi:hypothetical protein
MIPSAGTGDVEEVPFGVIDFLQVGVITDGLNALLQGNYFVIAGHHDHGPKLQTFGEVHRANRDVPVRLAEPRLRASFGAAALTERRQPAVIK